MRAKRTGRVKEVWKSKEDGWCMRQTIDDNRNVTLTYIHLPAKPKRAPGSVIKKGSVI